MKLDLSTKLKNINGEEFNETLGQIIAKILVTETKGDAIKYYDWALKLYVNESIEIDNSDKNVLKKFLESTDKIAILVKAQVFKILEELE